MPRTLLLALLVAGLLAASAVADVNTDKPLGSLDLTPALLGPDLAQKASGLFDTSKLSFQHTLGMSYGSGQYGGLNQYYLNTITYQVSKPLVIKAQVGFQNTLSGTPFYGSTNGSGTRVIVPDIGILYQPKPNLRIEFHFSNAPGYRYNPWGYRY